MKKNCEGIENLLTNIMLGKKNLKKDTNPKRNLSMLLYLGMD